ncbi:hypothetical protein OOK60_17125 [Trichothermofontia sichuanensis B231]|uniref:hypothetical protein n=1 Tax=Trichothermofontia sichuanensis TaxID=3045816 RepID=UPI002246FD87|nr:hypothetical protein [Trichothermofontia sichuanensis]UZQ54182.1 hypothetical protein OOK60_17125 [Trichothermofontia sichuanensis B231]
MDVQINRLEAIVQQIGDAVLATTETVERLSERVDALSIQVEQQANQVQQQGYQIFALGDAVQTLANNQDNSLQRLNQLTEALQTLLAFLESHESVGNP